MKFLFGLLIILAAFFRAVVFEIAWFWFIVPFGVPSITLAWAFGLSCTGMLFSPISLSTKKEDLVSLNKKLCVGIGVNIALLVFMFIGKSLMLWGF